MTIRNPLKEAVAGALFEKDYGEPWEEATETARQWWLEMADTAIRAMDRTEAMSVMHTLATVLQGVTPMLRKAAHTEAKNEAGKQFRKVTQQKRLEAAESAVDRAFEIMGIGS